MAPQLKVISRFGVGVDTIDLEGARRRRIYVTNAAGSNAQAVAELAVFLMLGVLRHGGELSHAMTEGRWLRRMGGELSGKTVGLIGFGEIGRRTAELVRAFGAEVIAYKRSPAPELAGKYGVTFLSREEVMENCDILSLHIPGTPDNYHMVNRETLARMRRGAILINTGREAWWTNRRWQRLFPRGSWPEPGWTFLKQSLWLQTARFGRIPIYSFCPIRAGKPRRHTARSGWEQSRAFWRCFPERSRRTGSIAGKDKNTRETAFFICREQTAGNRAAT